MYCDVIGGTPALALSRGYTYQNVTIGSDTQTTTRISGLQYSGLSSTGYTYTYDARGNITAVYKNNVLQASYEYDDLGQLTRENNVTANKTWTYSYDTKGNITSRYTYAYTTGALGTLQDTDTYEYPTKSSTPTWMDLLIKYNGNYIVYDTIGNPTSYYNGSSYSFTWSDGRKLTGGSKGTTSFSYTYNADGLRTQKTVGSTTYNYYWNGTLLSAMTITQNNVTETLRFYYDASGAPYCFTVGNSTFFYITNLQGDVVGIADPTYGTGGFYEYDAWGRIIHQEDISSIYTHALAVNPLRYRGYIYDDETGFYYLQSRYYDPTIRRFINADGYVNANGDLVGYNMFAYCSNNPVMGYDPTGMVCWWGVVAGAALIVAGVALAAATYGAGTGASALLFVAAAAIAFTGANATASAITESAMVVDCSVTPTNDTKVGISLVIDFGEETFDLYKHSGVYSSTGFSSPITYSVGKVFNYNELGDYGGEFVYGGGVSPWGYGVEYCQTPELSLNSCCAVSETFGIPSYQTSVYIGYDYYTQIGAWSIWGD